MSERINVLPEVYGDLLGGAFLQIYKETIYLLEPMGSLVLALLFEKQRYFSQRQQLTEDGFFYTTYETLRYSLGISQSYIANTCTDMEKMGILDTQFKGVPGKKYYKIDFDMLNEYITKIKQGKKNGQLYNTDQPGEQKDFFDPENFRKFLSDIEEMKKEIIRTWKEFVPADKSEKEDDSREKREARVLLYKRLTSDIIRGWGLSQSDSLILNKNKINKNKYLIDKEETCVSSPMDHPEKKEIDFKKEKETNNHSENKKTKDDKSSIVNTEKDSFDFGGKRTSNEILKEDYSEIMDLFKWAGFNPQLNKDSKTLQKTLQLLRSIENGTFLRNDFNSEWVKKNGIEKAFAKLKGVKFSRSELETLLRKPLSYFKKMRAGEKYFKIGGCDAINIESFLFESFKNKTSYFLMYLVNKPALNRNYVSDIQAERAKETLTVERLKMNWEWILGQLRGCNYSVGKWSKEEEQKALFSALHLFKWYRENHSEKPNLVKRFFEDIFSWLKTQNDVKPEFMSPSSPAWQWFNRFCKENLDGDWIVEKKAVKKPEPQKAGVALPSSLDEEELAQEIAEERGLTFVEALPIAKKQLQAEYQKKLKIS